MHCWLCSNVWRLVFPHRQEPVGPQPGSAEGHVVVRGSQLSLHHPGHQPPCRVCHARGAESSGETECHEQSFLEAGILFKLSVFLGPARQVFAVFLIFCALLFVFAPPRKRLNLM